ncbi:exodeoxyribonuclease V subunit beta [Thaumasiovibrio sp. DFM-14]|uniref:exodeoxyribonuclease V subunit beta n=1 Tax=Thaumasiovibrio sp. DFM-14 TaxID=3384792 RepID=UPI0039A2D5AA
MTQVPEQLDPMTLPLTGMRLIEASAGTGKTFTIAGLYLRLLLGHGGDSAAPRPLNVNEILVVTFTEAATAELRDRIRRRIHDARCAFTLGESDDPVIAPLLQATQDHRMAAKRLLEAERQMDEAAIYTIHGFCQRMLSQNAFESGALFENEFITDESRLRYQAVADYWRRRFYPLQAELAELIRLEWQSPYQLYKEIDSYLSGAPLHIETEAAPEKLEQLHKENLERIGAVKSAWLADAHAFHALISESGVNKRSYTKTSLPKALDEVTQWAQAPSVDYQLPKALEKFDQQVLIEKTAKGTPPIHDVFDQITELLASPPSLKAPLLADAIGHCRQGLASLKAQNAWLSFDDLLTQLSRALDQENGALLAERIRELYPVAMIDEFQDTDPLQYHIFSSVYASAVADAGLLMIGDPKQAIYAFRGADIFTYIQARRQVSAHYTLNTNWRSSAEMIAAANAVFSVADKPFVYDDDIPFFPVNPASGAEQRGWWVDGQRMPAMQIWQAAATVKESKKGQESQPLSAEVYRQQMAVTAAAEMARLLSLSQQGDVVLGQEGQVKPLQPGNMAVLVRTGYEARLIKQALAERGVDSVYLSNRDSVFSQPIAMDLVRILHAVLMPEDEQRLRAALATALFSLTALQLDRLNHDEQEWEKVVSEFRDYAQAWQRRGVMPMLRQLLQRRQIAERLLAQQDGERQLTDLLHIGELLQSQRQELDSDPALLRWFEQQISLPAQQSDDEQVRLESERNLVQIVTIHKSKGLEYDLVFLPFICHYRMATTALYHQEGQSAALLDLYNQSSNIEKADEERLAEDLRLLYVAVTRAVYGCYLGVAPIRNGRSSKEPTGMHHTAIGWLWQGADAGNCADWSAAVARYIAYSGQACSLTMEESDVIYTPPAEITTTIDAAVFQRGPSANWWLTSYSGLSRQGHHYDASFEMPGFDLDAATPTAEIEERLALESVRTIADFPKGAGPGTFLHTLFELVDFTQPASSEVNQGVILHQLEKEGYDSDWLPVIQLLIDQVLACPLDGDSLRLNSKCSAQRLTEMEFMFPVERLTAHAVNKLLATHDPIAAKAPQLGFETVSGMLKGFIDLIFEHQGRFYVLDWKSNWLGEQPSDYTPEKLQTAITEHRYDLQYQLYTLALHRYLSSRITDYDYDVHFGGVYYLFLRGIDAAGQTGIHYARPDKSLVVAFDAIMKGEQGQ